MTPSPSAKSKARPSSTARASRPGSAGGRGPAAKPSSGKAAPKSHPSAAKKPAGKPAPKPAPKGAAAAAAIPVPEIRRPDGRRHLLSLSFVRDGDEFLARLETDSGHITELKNRALDQLLTLVAGELEDLLE